MPWRPCMRFTARTATWLLESRTWQGATSRGAQSADGRSSHVTSMKRIAAVLGLIFLSPSRGRANGPANLNAESLVGGPDRIRMGGGTFRAVPKTQGLQRISIA